MKKLALLAATAVLAVPPATAVAKRIQHVGEIVGSTESKVRLRVTKKRGKIRKVTGFKAEGALLRCERSSYSLEFQITGAIKVGSGKKFKARVPSSDDPNEKLRVAGRVKNGGRKVVGSVKSNELVRDGEICAVPKQRFRTSKR
jgi:hypothetical protein